MIDKRLLGLLRDKKNLPAVLGLGAAGGVLAVLQADFLAKIINGVFLAGMALDAVWPWLQGLLGVILLRGAVAWAAGVLSHSLAAAVQDDIRQRLVQQLFALGPVRLAAVETGKLVNLLTQGVDNLEPYFARYFPQLATAVVVPVIILTAAFPVDLSSGLLLLLSAPLIPLFMILIGKAAAGKNQRQWQTLSRLNAHFLDVVQGLTTLKLFGRSVEQIQVIARVSGRFRDTTLGVLRIAFLSGMVLELLSTMSIALVAVTVGLKLLYGRLEFVQAFFLLLLAPEFYLPIRLLGNHFHAGMAGKAAAEDIFRLLEQKADRPAGGMKALSRQQQISVVFQQVCFSYSQQELPVLRELSFRLAPGAKVALVGPNGAGKTTAAHLLLGFIQPTAGRILVNGIPLPEIRPEDWLRQVAFVPQFPYVFRGTVADNIRLGLRTAGSDEVLTAARAARAAEFIDQLPQGFDTIIGDGGLPLSGGEIQRLAFARAFLRDAPLLVLDEATTALDPQGEMDIRRSLEQLMAGRTVLMIAHRLVTIRSADRICVLENGCLTESGSHAELVSAGGRYAAMVSAGGISI